MKNKLLLLLLTIAGAVLYNGIFWNESLALNAVLFDVFILCSLYLLYPFASKNNVARFLLPAHLISLITLIVFNSLLSKLAFCITLLLLVAFAEYSHRSIWFAGGSLLMAFVQFTGRFFRLLQKSNRGQQSRASIVRNIRFAVVPVLTLIVFLIIYSNANKVFADFMNAMLQGLQKFISSFFSLVSFNRFMFLLWGFYLTGSLLLRAAFTPFEKNEAVATDSLFRTRKKRMDINRSLWYNLTKGLMGKLAKGAMALKNEYKTGCISLALLNILLLFINLIDIDYLWLHFTYTPSTDLFTMIHEGTELLIFSIVLAMLILLVFFRGNLNFYKNNKWLKAGAYLWLLQNAVLVASVLLRDYYYIKAFGLAYKRIGVLFFLLLVIAGLVTVFLKIRLAKTNYFLLRINAWCVVVLLVLASTVQWDVLIARYNIAYRKTAPLNLPYLLTLSDKVLPVMKENLPILQEREKELNAQGIYLDRCINCVEKIISDKRKTYLQGQDRLSWLSWNYTDANEKKYFLAQKHP